ncbi:MAG: hypothetical protein ACRD7E_30920 [Bryobacteraceae bacterium]
MKRRHFLASVVLTSCGFAAAKAEEGGQGNATLRGKLIKDPSGKPAMQLHGGEVVILNGDADTMGVLKDPRLAGSDFEVRGQASGPGQFSIDPIHTRALFTYKDGERLLVTYWCDVCYIRTYTPGTCWCCQRDTALDLVDPDTVNEK